MKAIHVGLGLGVLYLVWKGNETSPGQVTGGWTDSDIARAGTVLNQLGLKAIMLGRYENTSSPNVLLRANVLNAGNITLLYDLATGVFTFSDRPREFYRAVGSDWIHDTTLERACFGG